MEILYHVYIFVTMSSDTCYNRDQVPFTTESKYDLMFKLIEQ